MKKAVQKSVLGGAINMDNYLSSKEALEALRTLQVSGQPVTQDAIE